MMLSIILPVFNAANYLEQCLNSIRLQTYKDFEVILINDGSKDNSADICEIFATKDNRFIYVNQENYGVAMARNKGLELAKGTFIGFVDADDTLEKDMLENLIKHTLNKKCDVIIAHYKICNTDRIHIPKTTIPCKKILNKEEIKQNILQTYYTGNDPLVPALWNKIYNRNFIEKHNLMFHKQKAVRASDYWFNFKVFQFAENVYVTQDANYKYNNMISGSIINTFRENQFKGFLETQNKLLKANETFKFKIINGKFYKPFFNNTNEFILTAIEAKGYLKSYSFIKSILLNQEFKKSFQYAKVDKIHIILLSIFIKRNMSLFAFFTYCIWNLKFKTKQ